MLNLSQLRSTSPSKTTSMKYCAKPFSTLIFTMQRRICGLMSGSLPNSLAFRARQSVKRWHAWLKMGWLRSFRARVCLFIESHWMKFLTWLSHGRRWRVWLHTSQLGRPVMPIFSYCVNLPCATAFLQQRQS